MQVKRIIGMAVLAVSVIIVGCLTGLFGKTIKYSDCIISKEQADDIIAGREEAAGLIDRLAFGEETLFYDDSESMFYYSLLGGEIL